MQGKSLVLYKVVVQIDMVVIEGPDPCTASVFGRQVQAEQCSCALHAHLAGGNAGTAQFRGGVLNVSGRCKEEQHVVQTYFGCYGAYQFLDCLVQAHVDVLLLK